MNNTRYSLITLITVFFFWGFVAASNAILIPLFKDIFHLTQFKAQLVEWAFYIAYFFGSLVYFLVSFTWKKDPINHFGYKKCLIAGLLVSAFGALCFIPASHLYSYGFLLASLFIVGLGFTIQQIIANPYIIVLGDRETGSHRLNLAGGVNSFGTTIGPVLLSLALFGQISSKPAQADISAVVTPSIVLCSMFLLSALVIFLSKLPPITMEEHTEQGLGALRYPQLTLGMAAIFFYVGAEVTIQSNLAALLKLPEIKGISTSQISGYTSLYWGSLMIGRWRGSISVFNLTGAKKILAMIFIPFLAFGVISLVNTLRNTDISEYKYYIPYILLAIAAFFAGREKPARTLFLFGCISAIMMVVGLLTTGNLALFSFISGGLFCSVMWPCIFTLAIAGLGKYTSQGASLLIMMVLGGAIIPLVQGKITDSFQGSFMGYHIAPAHFSYVVPVFCFIYIAYYGWKMKKSF
jgi:MFS transporter, FHS family, L-fucose permease